MADLISNKSVALCLMYEALTLLANGLPSLPVPRWTFRS